MLPQRQGVLGHFVPLRIHSPQVHSEGPLHRQQRHLNGHFPRAARQLSPRHARGLYGGGIRGTAPCHRAQVLAGRPPPLLRAGQHYDGRGGYRGRDKQHHHSHPSRLERRGAVPAAHPLLGRHRQGAAGRSPRIPYGGSRAPERGDGDGVGVRLAGRGRHAAVEPMGGREQHLQPSVAPRNCQRHRDPGRAPLYGREPHGILHLPAPRHRLPLRVVQVRAHHAGRDVVHRAHHGTCHSPPSPPGVRIPLPERAGIHAMASG
mmetsp:Transcript_35223/g.111316  ORF Transcript_35223/g.111316 Transcript_35223/m.111316 type:complete len:261 (-) Transcript_35223:170-952(-)